MDGRGSMPPWYEGRTRCYAPTLPCLMDTQGQAGAQTVQLWPPGHSNRLNDLKGRIQQHMGITSPIHRLSQKKNTYFWNEYVIYT